MGGFSRLLVPVMLLAASGCATPMAMTDIRAVRPNCAHIDRQIAALNLVAGTYGRNVAIATGEWAEAIDIKLAELKRAKKQC